MVTAKVFKSGNSQAIRIPSEFHIEQKEFYVRRFGDGLYLIPTNDPWYLLRNSLGKADDVDFERDQPELSEVEREEF